MRGVDNAIVKRRWLRRTVWVLGLTYLTSTLFMTIGGGKLWGRPQRSPDDARRLGVFVAPLRVSPPHVEWRRERYSVEAWIEDEASLKYDFLLWRLLERRGYRMVVKTGLGERSGEHLTRYDMEKADSMLSYNDSLPPRSYHSAGAIQSWAVSKPFPDSVRFSILGSSSPRRSEPSARH